MNNEQFNYRIFGELCGEKAFYHNLSTGRVERGLYDYVISDLNDRKINWTNTIFTHFEELKLKLLTYFYYLHWSFQL